jgi:hypothetical protein
MMDDRCAVASSDITRAEPPTPTPKSALAVLVVVAQLGAALHLVAVRHDVCPLDGELVEHRTGQVHAHAHGAASERLPRASGLETLEAAHGHEHCVLTALRRERATVVLSAVGYVFPTDSGLALVLTDGSPRQAQLAVHRLAPKQSPPA